jgi:hypothetical protein
MSPGSSSLAVRASQFYGPDFTHHGAKAGHAWGAAADEAWRLDPPAKRSNRRLGTSAVIFAIYAQGCCDWSCKAVRESPFE